MNSSASDEFFYAPQQQKKIENGIRRMVEWACCIILRMIACVPMNKKVSAGEQRRMHHASWRRTTRLLEVHHRTRYVHYTYRVRSCCAVASVLVWTTGVVSSLHAGSAGVFWKALSHRSTRTVVHCVHYRHAQCYATCGIKRHICAYSTTIYTVHVRCKLYTVEHRNFGQRFFDK